MCVFFRNLSNQLFRPYISHIFEVPLTLVSLKLFYWSCISLSNGFGSDVFRSLTKRKVKTENLLSTFDVIGVVNTEIFMSFIKLPFYKIQVNPNNLTFCFLGTLFWAPILVNQYEICSGYSPEMIAWLLVLGTSLILCFNALW